MFQAQSPFNIVLNGENLMEVIGRFHWVNEDIHPGNFAMQGVVGEFEALPIRLKLDLKVMILRKSLAKFEEQGWKLSELAHLLAFGEQIPAEQRRYFLYALGSVWVHGGNVKFSPCLNGNDRKLLMYLQRSDNREHLSADDHFLLVRQTGCS